MADCGQLTALTPKLRPNFADYFLFRPLPRARLEVVITGVTT
jgi:hypothetical protein